MKIAGIQIEDFRSIENLNITFPHFYTAICGKNDAGKSNVIRAMRLLFKTPERPFWENDDDVSLKEDYPNWKSTDMGSRNITCKATLQVRPDDDEGLYKFLESYLQLHPGDGTSAMIQFGIGVRYTSSGPKVSVRINEQDLEELKSQEILKKIKTSFTVLFHDSTEFFHRYRFLESTGLFRDIPATEAKKIDAANASLERAWNKIAKRDQEDLSELLGRLNDKYKIGLSIERGSDVSEVPYQITLGVGDKSVRLENWGSGTQNRTRILMALFKAKKIRDSAASAAKITPVIVIEEPESYLHPSAQAKFGAVLRDLSEEFKVQVIVTTHSPYLLNLNCPEDNILLDRSEQKKRTTETHRVDTSGNNWVQPFCGVLGMSSEEISPWRQVLFSSSDKVILVEGERDVEYIEWLSDEKHGNHRLIFDGTVLSYGGKDSLRQRQLLNLIMSRFKRVIVTYDLDAHGVVEPLLEKMGLKRGHDYLAIGKNAPGKDCIEGLLPDSVLKSVRAANTELVTAAMSASEGSKDAKNKLKKAYCEELLNNCSLSSDECKDFRQLASQLKKMLAS